MAFEANCLFCKIVKGDIPCFKVFESEHTLAFLDIGPVAEGHTQIIPKCHAVKLTDVPDEYLADTLVVAKKIAIALGIENFNLLQNNGKIAFQHVDHVHFHLIPKPSEKKGLCISEEKENWPREHPSMAELAKVHEELTRNLRASST